jgi:hypothetical protein
MTGSGRKYFALIGQLAREKNNEWRQIQRRVWISFPFVHIHPGSGMTIHSEEASPSLQLISPGTTEIFDPLPSCCKHRNEGQ